MLPSSRRRRRREPQRLTEEEEERLAAGLEEVGCNWAQLWRSQNLPREKFGGGTRTRDYIRNHWPYYYDVYPNQKINRGVRGADNS